MDINELKRNSVSITQPTAENSSESQEAMSSFVPGITQGPASPTRVSMTAMESATNRVKANMNSLPVEKDETPGVVKKDSLVKDILEGDQFASYRKEKNEYYAEKREEAELEMSEENRLNEQEENDLPPSNEYEDELEDVPDTGNPNETYKPIDIMGDVPEASVDFEEPNEVPPIVSVDVLPGAADNSDVITVDVESDTSNIYIDNEDSDEEVTIGISIEFKESDIVEDEVSDEERVSILKSIITSKIKPIKKRLNISSYTISKKINTTNAVIETAEIPAAKWILPYTGIVVMVKRFSGSELETIRACLEDQGRNGEDYRTVLNIIYNHIVSPKPSSFNTWLRSICFFDYDHLFFAAYISGFSGTNYIPIECENAKCTNKIRTYLTDDIPFMNMVKYKNETIEAEMKKLYASECYDSKGLAFSEAVPITDKIAIGFQMPSLYSALLEQRYFDTEFAKKYANTIKVLPYIDNLYIIDSATESLQPVGFKMYDNNIAKTTKSRVKRYDDILSTLTSDEFTLIEGIVNDIGNRVDNIIYCVPKSVCPFCGMENDGLEDQTALQLLFTRNRLGLLATS